MPTLESATSSAGHCSAAHRSLYPSPPRFGDASSSALRAGASSFRRRQAMTERTKDRREPFFPIEARDRRQTVCERRERLTLLVQLEEHRVCVLPRVTSDLLVSESQQLGADDAREIGQFCQ